MEASIHVRPRQVTDSQEQQIGVTMVLEDGQDDTGKEHVGDPLRKSGVDNIALAEPEATRSVSPFSSQTWLYCSPADIKVRLAVSIRS